MNWTPSSTVTTASDGSGISQGSLASSGTVASSSIEVPETLEQQRSIFEKEQLEWQGHLQRGETSTARKDVQPNSRFTGTAGTTVDHTVYASESDIPYEHVKVLGMGNFGWVDEVKVSKELHGIPAAWGAPTKETYARKTIPLTRRKLIDNSAIIRNEVDIISKLRHQHLVQLICTYQCDRNFIILMSPVAEGDLKGFLEEMDSIPSIRDKNAHIMRMIAWPGCLISVLQFLYLQRIRHKDIKPANILVQGTRIFLTDFGIAKDLADDVNTATTGEPGFHTALYAAPEVHSGEPRGRAADMFSLGCVFLEMATVMLGESLSNFHNFVETEGIRAYGKNEQKILQWLMYCWATWYQQWTWYDQELQCNRPAVSPIFDFATSICDVSFLMLDPDSRTRITAEQLVDLVASDSSKYREIMIVTCDTCRNTWRKDQEAPLHSYYMEAHEMGVPDFPAGVLKIQPPKSWDAAKTKWLLHHMHW
ncbi:MAG: hypothetical protein M1836_005009 [Candelina mexicana]|nr:MAG: hypothetical protein M1836_005009 [Candelina mexicana]